MIKLLEYNQKDMDYLTDEKMGLNDRDIDGILAKYEDDAMWEEKFFNSDDALKRLLIDVIGVNVTDFNRSGMTKEVIDKENCVTKFSHT